MTFAEVVGRVGAICGALPETVEEVKETASIGPSAFTAAPVPYFTADPR